MRRFEFVEGASNKFWEISVEVTSVCTRYGKIGSEGRQTVKEADSEAAAVKMAEKLVSEKVKKGYVEVGAVAVTAAAPEGFRLPARVKIPEDTTLDINHGVIAFIDDVDNRDEIRVIGPDDDGHLVELQWHSELYPDSTMRPEISGLKVVLYEGEPCLAISTENSAHHEANDGPAVGLYRLDGSPIAIHYLYDAELRRPKEPLKNYPKTNLKLLAVSLSGDHLAWNDSYTIWTSSIDDFVAGREPAGHKLGSVGWRLGAFDSDNALYIRPGGSSFVQRIDGETVTELSTSDKDLRAVEQGVLGESLLISGGVLHPLDSSAWSAAVGEDPEDEFEIEDAVGAGDIICIAQDSANDYPHLMCIRASTGEVLSVEKLPKRQNVRLFLTNNTLFVVDYFSIKARTWPADGDLSKSVALKPPKKKKSVDPVLARFQAYKALLAKHESSLLNIFEDMEKQFGGDRKLWHFEAPEPKSEAVCEKLLADAEEKYKGKFPAEIRKSMLELYAISDGFSFVFASDALPEPRSEEAEDEWEGPVGYQLVSLERLVEDVEQLLVSETDVPTFEGAIMELSYSDFQAGVTPNSSAFYYSGYLERDNDANDGSFCMYSWNHETTDFSTLALETDAFPGGYLDRDGDLQLYLVVSDGEPMRYSFAAAVSFEIDSGLDTFD